MSLHRFQLLGAVPGELHGAHESVQATVPLRHVAHVPRVQRPCGGRKPEGRQTGLQVRTVHEIMLILFQSDS